MSDDLITSLRALAAARHDDLSIAVDAVIEIERQRAEIERLQHQNRLFRKALSFVASYRSLHPDSGNLVASHMSSVANEALEGET